MKTLRKILYALLLVLFGLGGFVLGALSLGDYSPNMLRERITGETPQAKISAYLNAIQAQDRAAALEAWTLPAATSTTFAELSARRDAITAELLARQITEFTVFEPQWWTTCCEPGVTSHARNAGGARVQVQVLDAEGRPWIYLFDVFTDGPYFGDTTGNPYRHWLLRDVYPFEERPLYWDRIYTGEVRSS